eukprot:TRINITY_DN107_c0_g1_i4.p1 TRINITY_DN107_c0_g1~~TRINITY_DN107_c0_g1_i4.p1  ORF type:complete len:309 (-),score=62.00 TRINITY_DN107_c0_g1_i4:35-961(-)
MMHGLLNAAGVFVTNGKSSVAFYFAEKGYDVWLGNTRSVYQRHTSLPTNSKQYWDFCVDELGRYDFPAVIEYVVKVTRKKPVYMGHSQGGSQAYIGFQLYPDLSKQLSLFVGLCPAFYLFPIKNVLFSHFVIRYPRLISWLMGEKATFVKITVALRNIFPAWFYCLLGQLALDHCFHWSSLRWPEQHVFKFFLFTPAVSSCKLLLGWFAALRETQLVPCSKSTPVKKFEICNIECPVAIFSGGADGVVDCGKRLHNAMAGCNVLVWKHIEEYNHMDFVLASDIEEQVLKPILQAINTALYIKEESATS